MNHLTRVLCSLAVALAAMAAIAQDPALQCGLTNQPAATVLLPYFEVDLEDPEGRNTFFSVSNVRAEATLAHAVMWTNWGNPVLSFDFVIPAEGVRTMSVRNLIQGNLPRTSVPLTSPSGSFENCGDPLVNPQVDEGLLLKLLTGDPHPDDGLCYASAVEGGAVATGYITVDVVRDCSNDEIRTFRDGGYFQDGGGGLATNDNVLAGDFFLVDAANDFAQGEALVAVIADATRFGDPVVCVTEPCPPRTSMTFYRSTLGNRMPLPQTYRSRFLRGGGFSGGTDLLIWMDKSTPPSECGPQPSPIFLGVSAAIHSEAGDAATTHNFRTVDHASRVPVGGELLPTDVGFGHLDITAQYNNFVIGVAITGPVQMWVMPLHSASGRYSVGLNATPISDFCDE